jgi:hypothetical protein
MFDGFHALCAEVHAVVGEALNDLEFADLVERIASDRLIAVPR